MIRKTLCVLFLLLAASIAAAQALPPPSAPASQPSPQNPASAPTQPRPAPVVPRTHLKVGQPAPDFNLPSTIVGADGRGVRYKLSDFKDKKNVVLAFYVLAFTGG